MVLLTIQLDGIALSEIITIEQSYLSEDIFETAKEVVNKIFKWINRLDFHFDEFHSYISFKTNGVRFIFFDGHKFYIDSIEEYYNSFLEEKSDY